MNKLILIKILDKLDLDIPNWNNLNDKEEILNKIIMGLNTYNTYSSCQPENSRLFNKRNTGNRRYMVMC